MLWNCFSLLNYFLKTQQVTWTKLTLWAVTQGWLRDCSTQPEARLWSCWPQFTLSFSFKKKWMLNGIDIKIQMIRVKDEFCLMRNDDIAYRLHIVLASLFFKKSSISQSVSLVHTQALLSTTTKYSIDRVCRKMSPYHRGPWSQIYCSGHGG